jgi:viologen exporter family transport system ATP-binding protein
LLFLDEPTIGLDLLAKEAIRKFLKEINQEFGTTMLLTTHDLADIEELCDRLMLIDHGRILFDGPLDSLKARLRIRNQVRFELKDPEQANAIEALQLDGVTCHKRAELTCLLAFDRDRYATGDIIRRVVAAADVRDIFVEEESIESIIRRVYTDNGVLQTSR